MAAVLLLSVEEVVVAYLAELVDTLMQESYMGSSVALHSTYVVKEA